MPARARPKTLPEGFRYYVGTPWEDYSEEMLRANFDVLLDVIDGNSALIEEATCDWIACLALLGDVANVSFMAAEFPAHTLATRRNLCDVLFLVARLTCLLNFASAFRVAAENIVRDDGPYRNTPRQIESVTRNNLITNLAMLFNQAVLSGITFGGGTGFPIETSEEQIVKAFRGSIARDSAIYHHRVFALTEVIEPLRDPAKFREDYRLTFGGPPGDHMVDLNEGDVIRAALRSF